MGESRHMTKLDITTWGHAAVCMERAGRRLVIDPGVFSDQSVLELAEAVLVTHEHPDHFDTGTLTRALADRAGLHIWGPSPVVTALEDAGAPADRVHEAFEDTEFTAAGFTVLPTGRQHAVIHPEIAQVPNVAYLVEGIAFHPGDSFTPAPDGVDVEVLFLPISAPWLKLAESVDYLRRVDPKTAVPIHDAILSDAGREVADRVVRGLVGEDRYLRLRPGEALG
jgi:L-ascorbate metabolism protein UlaG (beta-lactamase superfamily)